MHRWSSLYPVKGILAFCSIVYELLLAQTMSVFLPNTVLHYCLTVGFYMFSLGIGAWLAERRVYKNASAALVLIEFILAAVGGFSVVILFGIGSMGLPAFVFMPAALALVISIGVITGFELPLLIELRSQERPGSQDVMLSWDYAGAVIGTVIFAAVFYARLGLIRSALSVGLLNVLAGMFLLLSRLKGGEAINRKAARPLWFGFILLGAVICMCLFLADGINRYFMDAYITQG